MWFDLPMEELTHDNDNERFSFITLAAATANVVRYLQLNKKKNEEREGDSESGTRDEKQGSDHRADVEQRLCKRLPTEVGRVRPRTRGGFAFG